MDVELEGCQTYANAKGRELKAYRLVRLDPNLNPIYSQGGTDGAGDQATFLGIVRSYTPSTAALVAVIPYNEGKIVRLVASGVIPKRAVAFLGMDGKVIGDSNYVRLVGITLDAAAADGDVIRVRLGVHGWQDIFDGV